MEGFHAIDVDTGSLYDVYIPPHTQGRLSGTFQLSSAALPPESFWILDKWDFDFLGIFFSGPIQPHTIVVLPNTSGLQLLMCYDNEGVYVDTYGKITKNVVLQWGELPTSVAYIGTGQIMGWGNKAIEIR